MSEQEKSSPDSQDHKKDVFEKQLNTINIVIAGIGIMFLIVFAGIGYLQVKSANELSDTMKDMKQEFKENIKTYKDELSTTLPRYEERIDRIGNDVNYKVDKKIEEFNTRFNEVLGNAPSPALLKLFYNGEAFSSTTIFVEYKKEDQRLIAKGPQLTIKNTGGKPTNEIAIYFLSNNELSNNYANSQSYPDGEWHLIDYTSDGEEIAKWKFNFEDRATKYLNPGEVWKIQLPNISKPNTKDEVNVKFQIFYGSEEFLVADLRIKEKK
jgi:gas vesicle protein